MENQNPIVRFLDDSTTEQLKNIKEKAQEALNESAKLKKILSDAQIKITELLAQL